MTQSIDQYIAAWLFIAAVLILILYFQQPMCIGGHDYATAIPVIGTCTEYSTWAILEFWKWTMIIVALLLAVKCCIDNMPSQAGTRDMEMAK